MNEIKVIQQLKGSANIVSIEDSAIPLLSFQASQLIDASVYQIREHRFGYLGASLLYAVMFDRRYSVLCICN